MASYSSLAHAALVMEVPVSWNLLTGGIGFVGRSVPGGRLDATLASPERGRYPILEAACHAAVARACATP
jgi:hypothetical protein